MPVLMGHRSMRRILPSSIMTRVFFPSRAQLVSYCSAANLPAGQPYFFAFLSLLPSLIRMMNGQNTAVLCRPSIKSTMPFVYPTNHTTSHHRHLFLISPTDPHPRPWASKTPSRPPHPSRLFNVLRRRSSSHPCHLETPFLATLPSRRSRAHTQFDMSREDRASWCARSRYYGGAVGRGGCGRPCMPWCLCVCYGGGGDARGRGWDGRSDRPWGWEVS